MTEQLVTFPLGLVGCESWKHFSLVEAPGEPIQQLICLDQPGIVLLTVEAAAIVPDYRLDLAEADLWLLGHLADEAWRVLCTLTLHRQPPVVTANLAGPLVINRLTGLGKQVVLVNSQYSLRHPVVERFPEYAHAGAD